MNNDSVNKFIDLIDEAVAALSGSNLNFDMRNYVNSCGTAVCICGDIVMHRQRNKPFNRDSVVGGAASIAHEFSRLSIELFGEADLGRSIWSANAKYRYSFACDSQLLSQRELQHLHLTTDHYDRSIAISYLELVRTKVLEAGNAEDKS